MASIEETYDSILEQEGTADPSAKSLELQVQIAQIHRENEALRRLVAAARGHIVNLEERSKEAEGAPSLLEQERRERLEERRVRDERVMEFEKQIGSLLHEISDRENALKMVRLTLEGAHEEVQRLTKENQELRMVAERHEQLSKADELTGLLNRHAFKTLAPSMFEMYLGLSREVKAREGGPKTENGMDVSFNAIYIDLNGFKEINDTIEHAAGDEALRRVADALRSAVRKTDPIFRMGGDEFLILFVSREDPATKKVDIGTNRFIVAERIRRALEKTGFTFKGVDTPNPVEVPPLTAMLGVAQYVPRPGEGFNEVVQAADAQALKLKAEKEEQKKAGTYVPTTRIAYAQEIQ